MMLTELKALALGFMNDMSGGDPVVRGLIENYGVSDEETVEVQTVH